MLQNVNEGLHYTAASTVWDPCMTMPPEQCCFPWCFVFTGHLQKQTAEYSKQEQISIQRDNVEIIFGLLGLSNIGMLWSVNSQTWIFRDMGKNNPLESTRSLSFCPLFLVVLFKYIQSCIELQTTLSAWRGCDGRDYWLCHLSTGSLGSLWIRLSVKDSGTCTWKDSVYKAAGAEEEKLHGATNSSFLSCCPFPSHITPAFFLTHSPLCLLHTCSILNSFFRSDKQYRVF